MRFVDEIRKSLPDKIPLPEPLADLLNWMEDNGYLRTIKKSKKRYADIYPCNSDVQTSMGFAAVDDGRVLAWNNNVDLTLRLAPIFRTGGDGSYAALWLDDDGKVQVVHMGSGSGSTYAGVMTDTVIDFIRLIAIGYPELCWPEHYGKSPAEFIRDYYDDDEDEAVEFIPPLELQRWVCAHFNTTIPQTASELVKHVADMDDRKSRDPFWMCYRGLSKKDVDDLGDPKSLFEAYTQIVPNGMEIPSEIISLFEWFAANEYVDSGRKGDSWRASLITRDCSVTPDYSFFAYHNFIKDFPHLKAAKNVMPLCYSLSGGVIGLWLIDGEYKTVHISPEPSGFTGILTHSVLDFVRLISMGYDSLSDPKLFKFTPEDLYIRSCRSFMGKKELAVFLAEKPFRANLELQSWVQTAFNVSIPSIGADIVACGDGGKRARSSDAFVKYIASI